MGLENGGAQMAENTSGRGKAAVLPDQLRGWNWGAFLLNVLWGIGNSTFIALLMFVPLVNLAMPFVLGAKGNQWAWANRPWHDVAHFRRVQRNWAVAGIIVLVALVPAVVGIFVVLGESAARELALERVRSHPQAVATLGEPIEAGWFTSGSIQVSGPGGEAEISFSVSGPKDEGTLYVWAVRETGKWRLVRVVLELAGSGRQLDLMAEDDAKKCAEGTGDLDLDIEHCTRAIDSGDLSIEDRAIAFINRGITYYKKGQYDEMITDFTQVIRLKPNDALAFNNRGEAYRLKGEYDRAISDYDRAIELDTMEGPRKAWPFNNRGNVYRKKGLYERAIADYDQAIRLDPNYALAYNNRGFAYHLKGEYDRAIQDHTAALRIKPNFVLAYNYRGNAYRKKGLYERAIADYEQAIRLQPDGDYAHQGLAWLLATASDGRYRDGARAVRLAKQAVALYFNEPANHDALAAAYAEAGRFEDAASAQERVVSMARAEGWGSEDIADWEDRLRLYRQGRPYREQR